MDELPGEIYTVGHSNRSLDEFRELLSGHGIRALADVRRYPTSRRWPHYRRENLERELASWGISYVWIPELGGRRHGSSSDSVHVAWKVAGFRAYAEHMESAEFSVGIEKLLAFARDRRAAVLCAEAAFFRCHRRLLADFLVVRGTRVFHIETPTRACPHELTSFARVVEGRILYDLVEPRAGSTREESSA
ncbi:MAG: hypothetical protein KatS3mg076_2691 [Candidatus Binatia bacterium]|nr:MAG: hypothetical protein KatS3mg076_2691 [Candidatus Binatia bacterium]